LRSGFNELYRKHTGARVRARRESSASVTGRFKDSPGIEDAVGRRLSITATAKEAADASEASIQRQERSEECECKVRRLLEQQANDQKAWDDDQETILEKRARRYFTQSRFRLQHKLIDQQSDNYSEPKSETRYTWETPGKCPGVGKGRQGGDIGQDPIWLVVKPKQDEPVCINYDGVKKRTIAFLHIRDSLPSRLPAR
jgi:hypothetical protein